mgnify:CR=1 FL=1
MNKKYSNLHTLKALQKHFYLYETVILLKDKIVEMSYTASNLTLITVKFIYPSSRFASIDQLIKATNLNPQKQ